MTTGGASSESVLSPTSRRSRVVLALLLADDTAVAALDADGGAPPEPWRRLPISFSEGLPPWTIAATIGTGTLPLRHRVLAAAALDAVHLEPRPRRPSDANAPWLWQRLAAARRASVVVGWPGVHQLDGPRLAGRAREAATEAPPSDAPRPLLHAATLAAIRQPRRLLGLAPPPDAPTETLVAPPHCATLVGETSLAALRALPAPSSDPLRIVAATVAVAGALCTAPGDNAAALVALGLDLRSRAESDHEGAAAAPPSDAGGDDPIEPACAALARLADGAPLLVVVQGGTRAHLLLHGVDAVAANPTPIDLAPTVLTLLGMPVPADLPGLSLCGRATAARTWDLGAWPAEAAPASASGDDDPFERALALLEGASTGGTGADDRSKPSPRTALQKLLTQHFETLWQSALRLADWPEAARASDGLRRLHGREIDLWRCAVVAERRGDAGALAAAARALRETFPKSRSTTLLPLLGPDAVDLAAQRALLETIEITSDLLPTQRSAIGRAAARAGLDDLARRALAPLVANGLAIPADRIALATLLQRVGEPQRAVAALGSIGLGAQSPPRLRLLRARCLHEAGFDDRAIALLEQHLATTPFDGEAKTLLATIRARPSR
jgi:hypothetical protein